MMTLPAPTPLTIPVEPTVAIKPLLLVQLPPPVASKRPVVAPTQTVADEGEIATGITATVTGAVAEQPATVYEMFTVPTVRPDTVPPLTVATIVLLLLHAPPPVTSVKSAV